MPESRESRTVAVIPAASPSMPMAVISARQLIERREQIQAAIKEVMVEGLHYGVIPGAKGLSLRREGAAMLANMFQIGQEPIVVDKCTPTEVRFHVECRLIHTPSQQYLGSGYGVCTSNEEKYRWRAAKSRKEYENADPTARRIKYKGKYEDQQVRASPWDQFQTIMSMAKKRAFVDAVKDTLSVGEVLTLLSARPPSQQGGQQGRGQPPAGWDTGENRGNNRGANPGQTGASQGKPAATQTAPQQQQKDQQKAPAQTGPTLVDEDQLESISTALDRAGLPDNAFLAAFELGEFKELEADRYEAAMSWIATNSP
jgi:hypothetical protein